MAAAEASETEMVNNVESDPLFVAAASNNFRLQPTSPAINAGTKPAGFEAIYPLHPNSTVDSPWGPVVATSDYRLLREIGAFVYPLDSRPGALLMGF